MAEKEQRIGDEDLAAIRQRVRRYDGRSARQLHEDALALLTEVDRLRAVHERLTHLTGVVVKGKGKDKDKDTERATLLAFVDRVLREGWNERQDSHGVVWCNGCGVQLYALHDNFASTHRSGCPVLKVIALVAAARQMSAEEERQ